MYRGRKQAGREIPMAVLTTGASGQPTAPDAVPVATVYGPDGRLRGGLRLPILEPTAAPYFFAGDYALGSDAVEGSYAISYRWLVAGVAYGRTDTFEVPPGGDGRGAVVSLVRYDRPHAGHLVGKRAAGRIYRGRGPAL